MLKRLPMRCWNQLSLNKSFYNETQNLISEDPESVKTANAKNVEEASDALLESIIVK